MENIDMCAQYSYNNNKKNLIKTDNLKVKLTQCVYRQL